MPQDSSQCILLNTRNMRLFFPVNVSPILGHLCTPWYNSLYSSLVFITGDMTQSAEHWAGFVAFSKLSMLLAEYYTPWNQQITLKIGRAKIWKACLPTIHFQGRKNAGSRECIAELSCWLFKSELEKWSKPGSGNMDEIPPSYRWIIMIRYKDPYKPCSTIDWPTEA